MDFNNDFLQSLLCSDSQLSLVMLLEMQIITPQIVVSVIIDKLKEVGYIFIHTKLIMVIMDYLSPNQASIILNTILSIFMKKKCILSVELLQINYNGMINVLIDRGAKAEGVNIFFLPEKHFLGYTELINEEFNVRNILKIMKSINFKYVNIPDITPAAIDWITNNMESRINANTKDFEILYLYYLCGHKLASSIDYDNYISNERMTQLDNLTSLICVFICIASIFSNEYVTLIHMYKLNHYCKQQIKFDINTSILLVTFYHYKKDNYDSIIKIKQDRFANKIKLLLDERAQDYLDINVFKEIPHYDFFSLTGYLAEFSFIKQYEQIEHAINDMSKYIHLLEKN